MPLAAGCLAPGARRSAAAPALAAPSGAPRAGTSRAARGRYGERGAEVPCCWKGGREGSRSLILLLQFQMVTVTGSGGSAAAGGDGAALLAAAEVEAAAAAGGGVGRGQRWGAQVFGELPTGLPPQQLPWRFPRGKQAVEKGISEFCKSLPWCSSPLQPCKLLCPPFAASASGRFHWGFLLSLLTCLKRFDCRY